MTLLYFLIWTWFVYQSWLLIKEVKEFLNMVCDWFLELEEKGTGRHMEYKKEEK